MKMVTPSNGEQRRYYDKVDDRFLDYKSPYVEISGDNLYESSSSSNYDGKGSINSFLEEAEIITQSEEHALRCANQRMRVKLNSYFMNPVQKWKKRNRFPWKLCVQLIKIILATSQMLLFGHHSFTYMQQHIDMTMALNRILLKDWSADVSVYPPSIGPYAVYTIPEFYDNLDFAIRQYTKISSTSIGPFAYDNVEDVLSPMEYCYKQYNGSIFANNSTVAINSRPEEKCLTVPALYPSGDPSWDNFSMEYFLHQSSHAMNFKTLIYSKLKLRLKTIFIKSLNKLDFPECYRLKLLVKYDNSEHDGQVLVSLAIKSTKLLCHVDSHAGDPGEETYFLLRQILNILVIVVCAGSMALCVRSLFKGYSLARETSDFFRQYYQKEVPLCELMDFIDFWYVNIVASDVLLIVGSAIKASIEEQSAEGSEYAKCSILLGVGNLLIWIGILRYLGFFPKYNMLILTLKRALPNVLRFLICAVLLFLGSCFCAWIVLSPYHIKFRTLSRTAECLFAIMNGDDMFATFALLDTRLDLIWWFTRIFLYIFLLVFVYIVVSLFISVIMDTFETIKHMYVYGAPPRTIVEVFLSAPEGPDEPLTPPLPNEVRMNYFQRLWNWLKYHTVICRGRL